MGFMALCFGRVIVFCWGVLCGSRRDFILCLRAKVFVIVLVGYFVCPPGYFVCLILVLFCGVIYSVLCMCCVFCVSPPPVVLG